MIITADRIDQSPLLWAAAISSVSPAELANGPHAITDQLERSRRQERLQRVELEGLEEVLDVVAVP